MENFNSFKRPLSFQEAEFQCNESFRNNGPFWHLCTDGNSQQIIFTCDEDFCAAMNAMAIVLATDAVKLVAFILMNNHLHWIIAGKELDCREVFRKFTKRMRRYFAQKGRPDVLNDFECEMVGITDVAQMRTEIAYVHRNLYVVRADVLPYTYRWSSGYLYFNRMVDGVELMPFSKVSYAAKREMFQGRIVELPGNYKWVGDHIPAVSFVDYKLGESFFRNAAEYFIKISKIQEDHCLLVQKYGESQVLNYEEGYSVASSLGKSLFGNHVPSALSQIQKNEVARKLRYDYKMGNKQIAAILKMDIYALNNMFPSRSVSDTV